MNSSRRTLLAAAGGAWGALRPAAARADDLADGRFAQHVARLVAAAHPGWRIEPGPDAQTLVVQGARLFLGNIHRHLQGLPPAGRDAATLSLVEAALRQPSVGPDTALEAVRERLRLQLVPAEYRAAVPGLVARDFPGGLLVAYAIDEPDRFTLVQQRQLDAWRIAPAELDRQALGNLEAASLGVALEVQPGARGGRYCIVATSDGYDAARILLPRFMARLREGLGTRSAFVGIPNRDFLVAWTADLSVRSRFAAQIRRDQTGRPHPRTDMLFVSTQDGVRAANAAELAEHGR